MILITGGAGYIGSHVNKRLHQLGFETIILDNFSRGHRDFVKWGQLVEGDLLNPQDLDGVFAKYPIQAVIHFAAYAFVGESFSDPHLYYRNNVMGSHSLLEAMRRHGVSRMVFSSTCSVYGEPPQIPIPETRVAPINPYGATKALVERMLEDYDRAYGIKSVILRYFNAAGADREGQLGERHQPEYHLIPLVIQTALGQREAVQVFGDDFATPDGTCLRDYIDVTDLASAHEVALRYLLAEGKSDLFNLGSGRGSSVKEVIQCVQEISGVDFPVQMHPRRAGDPMSLVADFSKARRVLGWEPHNSNLKECLQAAWSWHVAETKRNLT